MAKADLTAQRLRELFDYNPETGAFVRQVRCANAAAGSVAGCNKNGYSVFRVDGVLYRAHRLAWLYVFGTWPARAIDHINGEKSDNRIQNLREASHSLNMQNARRPRKNNSSGILGVHYSSARKRWVAQIGFAHRVHFLGHFTDKEEAACAYLEAKRAMHEGNTL